MNHITERLMARAGVVRANAAARAGLEAAARFLEATAANFDEMAQRNFDNMVFSRLLPGERDTLKREAYVMEEKARLLRGQAGLIREL